MGSHILNEILWAEGTGSIDKDVLYHDDAAQSSEISGDAENMRMMFPDWIVTSIAKTKVPS